MIENSLMVYGRGAERVLNLKEPYNVRISAGRYYKKKSFLPINRRATVTKTVTTISLWYSVYFRIDNPDGVYHRTGG
jgi:hypothetical protein